MNLPFAIRQFLVAFEDMNKKILFVARTLGCNKVQVFHHIIIPLMKNTLISTVIMTWSRTLGEYGAVIMVQALQK